MLYVDELLCITKDTTGYINQLNQRFKLKPTSVGSPETYLGNSIMKRYSYVSKSERYSMGYETYVSKAIRTIKYNTATMKLKLPEKGLQLFTNIMYHPKLYTTEVSRQSTCCSTNIGYLNPSLSIISYLDKHRTSWITFDPCYIKVNWTSTSGDVSTDVRAITLREQYPNTVEYIPPNIPEPLGKEVQINCFVDADHDGNKVT